MPPIPADQDPLLHARRIVAQRCLYGVDKNPFAVNLAKLSLWLATFAKDHPFTFVDHTLRCGDSLVGLTAHQIEAFHWQPKEEGALLHDLPSRLLHILNARAQILNAADETPYETLAQNLALTEEQMIDLRLAGDLTVAAYFAADKPKERETRRKEFVEKFRRAQERFSHLDLDSELLGTVRTLKTQPKGVTPFHWELEFPEVFTVDVKGKVTGGFDAIVGNPPFLGGQFISGVTSDRYLDFLKTTFEGTERVTDLVAFFFRRAFTLIRLRGTFGLVATNTISQGDTRIGGLYYIRHAGGRIYCAVRRLRWPGLAAVVVSQVYIQKAPLEDLATLDGKSVKEITSFLYSTGGDESPNPLAENARNSHHGSYIYGAGFTFADDDPDATPLYVANELLAQFPDYSQRILPYLSGEDILRSPTQSPSRMVINLHDLEEAEAWSDFSALMKIVEAKVLPERLKLKDNTDGLRYKANWWRWARHSEDLDRQKQSLERVLVHPFTSGHLAFAFVPARIVVGSPHNVFTFDSYSAFAALQSRVHEAWVRFFASSLKDDLRYTRSDCFETFPLPPGFSSNQSLEEIGRNYYEYRAALMIRRGEGLTKTYNRFHDPTEVLPEVLVLRDLHAKIDRAAIEAYGWHDLVKNAKCDFILDYEEDERDMEGASTNRGRKKPWRYRWPDEDRDDVLARLLELNRVRSEEEAQSAAAAPATKTVDKRGRKSTKIAPVSNPQSFRR